jgi:hypothetical protein
MKDEPFDAEAVIDAMAPLLGLTIDEASRPADQNTSRNRRPHGGAAPRTQTRR